MPARQGNTRNRPAIDSLLMPQVSLGGCRVNKMALMSRNKESGARGAPGRVDDTPHYQAFLSYSHHDSAHADWLHKAIERFAAPKGLVGRVTVNGAVPRSLTPIFRDRLVQPIGLGAVVVAVAEERLIMRGVIHPPRSAAGAGFPVTRHQGHLVHTAPPEIHLRH